MRERGRKSKSEEASPGSVLTLPFSWPTVDPSCCKLLGQQTGWPEEAGCPVVLMLQVESDASCVLGMEKEGMNGAGPEEVVLLPAGASGPYR